MAKRWSWSWSWASPLLCACVALQAFLCWSCCSAQVPGFLSIDCGSNSTAPFTDENGIEWISDLALMSEGEPITVAGENPPLSTMRYFNGNQSKYCYNLSNSAVQEGAFFLVRASFWAGDPPPYPPKSSDGQFLFKILIDADDWTDVVIADNSTNWLYYEIYTRALRSSINVCLARSTAEGDAPFISALELRPLPSSLSATLLVNSTSRHFVNVSRWDYGISTPSPSLTRYPLDSLDRIWQPVISTPSSVLVTTSMVHTSKDEDIPPANVLQTAFGGTTQSGRDISTTFSEQDVNGIYYCVLYFAEIDQAVNASGQRVFNIVLNEEKTVNAKPIDVFAAAGGAYVGYEILVELISPTAAGQISFSFNATADSVFPPFLAALELFQASNNTISTGSFPSDVSAIEDLKTATNLNSYSGDPCLPNGFGYPWLTCNVDTTSKGVPRVTSISLSNYSMGGEIPKTINTLTMLDQIVLDGNNLVGSIPNMSALASLGTLDLSNNNLSGSIPESLATLKNLKVLNLENNILTGEIPPALLERKRASTLDFEFSGNPFCQNGGVICTSSSPPSSSPKAKSNTGSIIGVLILILVVVSIGIGLTVFCHCCHKDKSPLTPNKPFLHIFSSQQEISLCQSPNANPVIDKPLRVLFLREFTFQEVKIATKDFSTQLGKGGFGPVYKGTLQDERVVAIKVASDFSQQGSKEFSNEVDLLSRVHHKNLVGLLGYCNQEKLVLVYEFMSNGSLFDCLHGSFAKTLHLSWSTRLKILVDAAQGLDYLHYGCNPRIIHRDIKSSNILLNDKLEAKISDFGISRNIMVDESGAPTTALMGSMGYLDQE